MECGCDWLRGDIMAGLTVAAYRAMARLQFGGRDWVGAGLSRLSPGERCGTGIGDELAVARALSDPARGLTAVCGAPV